MPKRADREEGDKAAPMRPSQLTRAPGAALDPGTRAFMETRFGCSFADVRVHADSTARASGRALNARAYTLGNHIVFGTDSYAPETVEGQRLLAHELSHVVQQRGVTATASSQPPIQRQASEDDETRADAAPGQQEATAEASAPAEDDEEGVVQAKLASEPVASASATAAARVHAYTDRSVAHRAQGLNALAYAVRDQVFVPPGLDNPRTATGRSVLAHELAHAQQWRNGQTSTLPAWSIRKLEDEAHHVAAAALRGQQYVVRGIHRGIQPLTHPVFISTHGSRGYLRWARRFYEQWGYGSPVSVGSIEEMVGHLASGSGAVGRVTLVSHAVPQNINISFLRGGPGYVLEGDWQADSLEEVLELAEHIVDESFLREVHALLRRDDRASAQMRRASTDWLGDSVLQQYLWWVLDAWFIRNQRGGSRRERRRVAALAEERIQQYRAAIGVAQAAVAGLGSSGTGAFAPETFEQHFARVMTEAGMRPGRISMGTARRTVNSPTNRAVSRVLTEATGAGAPFLDNLGRLRPRLNSSSCIEIQGCRVGRQPTYLSAMSGFFGGARITAPDWFQGFGTFNYHLRTRAVGTRDRDLQRLWRTRGVQDAFNYWYPIMTGESAPDEPTWQDLGAFLNAGHPLLVGRQLITATAMGEAGLVEFLRLHGYRINQDEAIRDAFLRGRRARGATGRIIIDWLQEQRGRRGPVLFRPDPEYHQHIISSS